MVEVLGFRMFQLQTVVSWIVEHYHCNFKFIGALGFISIIKNKNGASSASDPAPFMRRDCVHCKIPIRDQHITISNDNGPRDP